MLTNFQTRKFAVEFLLFDHNRDGVVEQDDLRTMADALASDFGWSDGSDDHSRCRATFDTIWQAFWASADGDGDGRVTLAERLAAMEYFASISHEQAHAQADPVISGLFDVLDTDGDGFITSEEFARFVRANQVPEAFVEEAVSHVVPEGKLSREEYVTTMVDYYLTDDPDAKANWAWGMR